MDILAALQSGSSRSMYRIIFCVTHEHMFWVVPLATLVCWLSCHSAMRFLQQARTNRGAGKIVWLVGGAVAAGIGIWSTHFIGMLGYDPGIGVGYDLPLTLLSLASAIFAACVAFAIAQASTRVPFAALAGIVLALGVAAMHFTGMASIRMPGTFVWHMPLIITALIMGCILSAAALVVSARPTTSYPHAVAATLLAAGVASLHFLAMAAAEAVPDLRRGLLPESLPREAIALAIATGTLPILAFSVLTFFSERLRRTREALQVSEERLALALDAGSDGLWDCDLTTGRVWASDRWWQVLGYEPGDLEPNAGTWRSLIHPDDTLQAQRVLDEHLSGRAAAYECEHRLRRKDGTWAWMLTRGRVTANRADGTALRFVGTQIDISARKAAEGQIAHMACHDVLTDLPNRLLFHERLVQKLAEVSRYGGACAVLCLDLDRFKTINDTLGHLAGDAVLCAVAQRLHASLRPGDTVARLGGDEFAILLGGASEMSSIASMANRLIAVVQEPIPFGDQSMRVGLSIGVALVPEHGTIAEELFKRADLALYRAKAEGRNTHRFFEPVMDELAAERRNLERDLRRAIEADGLTLHYQPQVSTETNTVIGFEALVRWPHAVRGLIPPANFIPIAEETGLIAVLGEWVLRKACREAAKPRAGEPN